MMSKPYAFLFAAVLFVCSCFGIKSSAGDPDVIDPDQLFLTADNTLFLREGPSIKFPAEQHSINEFLDGNILHQYYVRENKITDSLTSMMPADRSVRAGNPKLNFTDFWGVDFHFTLYMSQQDNIPEGSGGLCWFRYSNGIQTGNDSASGLLFYPGGKVYAFSPSKGAQAYKEIADISMLDPSVQIRFDLIRLDGTVYVYADGTFLFRYTDGLTGPLSPAAGSELFENGNYVMCSYSDLTMRYR